MLKVYREFKSDLALIDRQAAFALIYAAVGLTAISYLKNPQILDALLGKTSLFWLSETVTNAPKDNLYALCYWVLIVSIFYFAVPALVIKFVWKRPLADFGLKFSLETDFLRIFSFCAAVMLPIVYAVSLTESFLSKYPFYRVYDGSPYLSGSFFVWETVYFIQFFALEFFFRGFLVHSLKPALRIYSIFVMMIPYCMIHFGKPPAETLAAIFAGIFLGWLSYKHGTIWLGLLLHCTVALTMDVLALYQKGLLF